LRFAIRKSDRRIKANIGQKIKRFPVILEALNTALDENPFIPEIAE
jgi:hypothetical protein